MISSEKPYTSGRAVHKTGAPELVLWDLVAEAIKSGKTDEALDRLKYARSESHANNDGLVGMVDIALARLASIDEEEVYRIYRQRYYQTMQEWTSGSRNVAEIVQHAVKTQSRHHAIFTVTEEPDRYIVTYDPCGSGGRLRRTRSCGTTKESHPWSFGRAGVPYYCCHCCIRWEVLSTELAGYPGKIALPGERPEDPCINLFYKKPELIPEEYFTRIGMTKDSTRFSR